MAKAWELLSPAYRRRLERERERASREGRPFSRSRARGHKSNEHENQQRRIRNLARRTNTPRAAVDQALQTESPDRVENLLRDKKQATDAYRHGDKGPGQDRWQRFQARVSYLPVEFFYYH